MRRVLAMPEARSLVPLPYGAGALYHDHEHNARLPDVHFSHIADFGNSKLNAGFSEGRITYLAFRLSTSTTYPTA